MSAPRSPPASTRTADPGIDRASWPSIAPPRAGTGLRGLAAFAFQLDPPSLVPVKRSWDRADEPGMAEGCRGVIASYVNGRAYEPGARLALERLGYRVVWASTQGRFDDSSWRPSVRIADECHLERLPSPQDDRDTPIIALTGPRPRPHHDARITARIRRPAALRELYGVLQRVLETHPRGAPRAPTRLAARLGCNDRRWNGDVVTLSEIGCLYRNCDGASLPASHGLNVQLALPFGETVSLRARSLDPGERDDSAALVFEDASAEARARIARYVTTRLATL